MLHEPLSTFYKRGRLIDLPPWKIWVRWTPHNRVKPKLLLLHGFPTGSYDWAPIWGALSDEFSLLAFDMLGFGASDRPVGHDYSIVEQADITIRVLRAMRWLNVPICILAHDYGLSVFQEVMVRDIIAMQHAVLLNGGLFARAHRPLPLQAVLAVVGPIATPLVRRGLYKHVLAQTFFTRPPSRLLDLLVSISLDGGPFVVPSLLGYIKERHRNDRRWTDVTIECASKLSLVWGSADRIAGEMPYELVAKSGRTVPIRWIHKASHYPQWEAPQATAAAILEMFRSTNNFYG